jgi:hypothetical protein
MRQHYRGRATRSLEKSLHVKADGALPADYREHSSRGTFVISRTFCRAIHCGVHRTADTGGKIREPTAAAMAQSFSLAHGPPVSE